MGGFFNRFDATKVSVIASDLEVDSGTLSIDEVNNRVGIGTTEPAANLEIASAGNAVLILDSGADSLGELLFYEGSQKYGGLQKGTGGAINFQSDRAGNNIQIKCKITGETSMTNALKVTASTDPGEVCINEGGAPNLDFRVEGDANTHMLFVDSENDLVIIDWQDSTTSTHNASLIVDGPTAAIAFKEMAAAPADIAGFGQIWVKSDAPNTLYFTSDTGVDTQLGAGGGGATANDLDHILHQQVFS